jgi:hypothetical protein
MDALHRVRGMRLTRYSTTGEGWRRTVSNRLGVISFVISGLRALIFSRMLKKL